jgi:thiol:disulfide interchange protein DsbC
MVRGNGKRKIAVFEDPNCGYCKRFEKDLAKINNVTVHFS